MAKLFWYAVMKDREDDDWGTGSFSLAEAERMALDYGKDAYIAIIQEAEDPLCVGEIEQADFEISSPI